jgi:hypothetical protein
MFDKLRGKGVLMAFTEDERKNVTNLMNVFIDTRRPPESVRDRVDLGYRIERQSIIIYELRRSFRGNEMEEIPVAKTTYIQKDKKWKIYWMRADLKWHSYYPEPEVTDIEKFITIVDEDLDGCFWG